MRCNFTEPNERISAYFDIAQQTDIREIRCAIPIPNAKGRNRYVDTASLHKFGNLLDRFVLEGKQRGVTTKLAKPFFPCKLSYETNQTFFSNGSMATNCPVHLQDYSNNLTVYPDGSFIPCLGVSMLSPRHLLSFDDTIAAARIFKQQLKTLMKVPLLDACNGCPLWKGCRCVGACLSYRLTSPDNDYRMKGG
jgi:radical SAM protein with 4Fe4S-binding SPASM domain